MTASNKVISIEKATLLYSRAERAHKQDHFLLLNDVMPLVGIGKTTVYKLMKEGLFPKNFSIHGSTTKAWSYLELMQWMEQQKQGRNNV